MPLPLNPMDTLPRSTTDFQTGHRKLRIFFYAFATLLGFGQAWAGRFQLNSDGLNYVELGEAFLRGDWHGGLNAYWSPLYPWLLGAGLKLFHPPPVWEFQFIHSIDFLIYLVTLSCFDFFLAGLIEYHRNRRERSCAIGLAEIPPAVWLLFGYTLFLIASLRFISVSLVIPDMCVAALLYLAAGLLLRIHTSAASRWNYFVLGIILGVGYLAKTAVLPIAFVFILCGVLPGTRIRKAVGYIAINLAGLALIAAPYIIALSLHQGYATYGETGRLAYASMVNHLPQAHWQGEPPGFGKPVHPTRKIFDRPAAFEFASPIPGTYPPGYDPTYWNEGVAPHFDFQQEKARIVTSATRLFDIFFGRFASGLIAGILVLYILTPTWRVALRNLAGQWFLFLPPLVAFLMYALVLVETRYIGAYYVVFCAGMMASVPLPDLPEAKKLASTLTAQIVSVTLLTVLILTLTEVIIGAKARPVQWEVAEYLHQAGVGPGEHVAEIGGSGTLGWARLARVRITAEVPSASMWDYNRADNTLRSKVVSALFATGVKAIVSGVEQDAGCPTEWRAVADTGMYVCSAPGLIPAALPRRPGANLHSGNH